MPRRSRGLVARLARGARTSRRRTRRLGDRLGCRRRLGSHRGRGRVACRAPGELGPQLGLQLGRHLTPRAIRRSHAGASPCTGAGADPGRGARSGRGPRGDWRPAGPRTTAEAARAPAAGGAAAAEAFAIEGHLVGAAPTPSATSARARRCAALLPSLGEQVFGDLRLVVGHVVELLSGEDGRARHAQLTVPDGAEGRRLRRPRGAVVDDLLLHHLTRFGQGLLAGHRALAPATATATATAAAAAARRTFGVDLPDPAAGRDRLVVRFDVRLAPIGLGLGRGRGRGSGSGAGQAFARQRHHGPAGCRRGRGRLGDRRAASTSTGLGRHGWLLALGARPGRAAAARCALALLVGHRGHGQVVLRRDAAAAARRFLLHARDLGDVGEDVGHVHQVGAGVAPEADDLDADAHLLDGADGRGEVAVARDDDRDVEVPGGLHEVDHELDVQVGLDLPVTVLADVLAHDLVVVPGQELMELALVVVVRVQPGVGVGAHEIAPRRGALQQRDVVDVHAGRLGRVEDVGHVYEDRDILAHASLLYARATVRWAGMMALNAPDDRHPERGRLMDRAPRPQASGRV